MIAPSPSPTARVDASVAHPNGDGFKVHSATISTEQNGSAHCPICECTGIASHSAPQWYEQDLCPEDLRITDSRYGMTLPLLRCSSCEFLFADSQQVAKIPQLYAALQDVEYSATQDSRELQMRWLIRLVRQHAPEAKTLLDVGAGSGLLVREATSAGLDAAGVEPSEWLVKEALSRGTKLFCGTLPMPALAAKRFDVVTAVDVIEHVGRPAQFLADCMQHVDTGGVLVLVTPDVGSLAARLLGRRWWHFRLAHIGYFKKKSLMRMFSDAGLEPICWTRAKWFFSVRYIAKRLERYLPGMRGINRVASGVAPLRWLYSRVVCLNLRDSYVVIVKRQEGGDVR